MNPWRGLAGLPREVWLLCASTLVNRLGTMALPFLVLYLTDGRRWTPQEASFGMMVWATPGCSRPASGPPGACSWCFPWPPAGPSSSP